VLGAAAAAGVSAGAASAWATCASSAARDRGQAEPGRLIAGLGGEERLERVLRGHRVHPGPGVGDPDLHVVAGQQLGQVGQVVRVGGGRGGRRQRVDVRGGDRHPAAVRHRVPRVQGQVDDGLLEQPGVGLDRPQARAVRGGHRHMLAEHLAEQPADVLDQPADVHRPGLGLLPPGEREHVLDQPLGPVGGVLDLLQVPADRPPPGRAVRRLGDADFLADQARVVGDHREHVVEVVRDPADELAQAVQPPGPLQLEFHAPGLGPGLLGLGQVQDPGGQVAVPGGRLHRAAGQPDADRLAVPADQPGVGADRAAARAGLDRLEPGPQGRQLIGVHVAPEVLAGQLVPAVTGQRAVRVVHRSVAMPLLTAQADGEQAERGGPELLLVALLARGQLLVRGLAIRICHGCLRWAGPRNRPASARHQRR